MTLDSKLLNVVFLVIVAGPVLALIVWRLWRGEVRFHGFWASPTKVRKMDQARREAEEDGATPRQERPF